MEKIEYLKNVSNVLDKCIYGHKDAKKQISRLVGQWMNGKMSGTCIGFCGPPGVGKTTICKNGLSKCLVDTDGKQRPFAFIPLGGTSNGSLLEGHHYTYLGSTWGKMVDVLINSKCMNPIIYIDELDKVSRTENGKEIISILTHLTDQSQNMEFNDRYFSGIPLDMSKAIFVFSYNDSSKIDRILRDRIHEITIKPLNKNEKIKITKNYLLPEILSIVGFNSGDIRIKNKDLEFLIENYTYEAGVRKLHEHLLILVREINLLLIMDEDDIQLPFIIREDYIKKVFSEKQLIKTKKIFPKPQIGLVNGLYATNAGMGGITIIEVLRTPSERAYSLQLTGQQGDVMKESMYCAKTLAWNLIPANIKKEIKEDWENNGQWGLHIHCPEGATPKDGPSAGCAITIAIISRMCGINVRNTIAITGEIDLNGNIGQVGGISSKLEGALVAGVKKVFIPKDNEDDYIKHLDKLKETMISSDEYSDSEYEGTQDNKNNQLKVIPVSRIEDVLSEVFTKKLKFNKIK
jgi:ATP-dependent Lon protease